jgi:AcrR family transcriptional regulator
MDDVTKKLGKSDRTRAAILAAARERFASEGFERATVREIAAKASIDPALVIRYFGSKEALFVQAADIELRMPDLSTASDSRGEAIVRHFLSIWEGPGGNPGMTILLRSAASNPIAAEKLRDVFAGQVLPALGKAGGGDPGRAGLVSSQLLGLAFCRYVFDLPPVVAMPIERIVREVGATVQRYLDGA